MNELINIRHTKKIILNEIKNKIVDKTQGNSILGHLDNMENEIKTRKKIGNHLVGGDIFKDILKENHLRERDKRLNEQFDIINKDAYYKEGLRLLIERAYGNKIIKISPEFVTNCIFSYINLLGLSATEFEYTSPEAWIQFGWSKFFNNRKAVVLYRRKGFFEYFSQEEIFKLFDNIEDVINKFFKSEEAKHMLSYLVNHYTKISIVFGVGVLAYSNPYQILNKISNIISFSYNQDKKLSISTKVSENSPIIVLPPSIKDSDIDISVSKSSKSITNKVKKEKKT